MLNKFSKILLLGEYSSYYNNLALGLKELGYTTLLVSDGDGWKNYYRDVDISGKSNNKILSQIYRIIKEYNSINNFCDFDIVQIANPIALSRFGFSMHLYNSLIKKNRKIFLSAVGDDYFYWKAYREGQYRISPHKGTLEDNNSKLSIWEQSTSLKRANILLAEKCDGIIPGSITYSIAYERFKNKRKIIPFPIHIPSYKYEENKVKNKIVFYHGAQLSRYGFKGTHFIDGALNLMRKKYPSDIEYVRTDSIAYSQYLKLLNSANVVIDQTNSFEPAMNALTCMALGKLVMGGCKSEFMKSSMLDRPPLINIEPNVEQIQKQIAYVIENRKNIPSLSYLGREYVAANHDSKKVASQFLVEWIS